MAGSTLAWRKRASTSRIILHASHTHEHEAHNLEAWLRVTGRKMGLLEIGYHFIVFADGRHLMVRPHDAIGSHTPGFNKDSIGIVLQGGVRLRPGEDGEEIRVSCDTFTPAQMDTLKFLWGWLNGIYPGLELKAHSELGRYKIRPVQCPPVDIERIRTQCRPMNQTASVVAS
jgi:hypothetical protein